MSLERSPYPGIRVPFQGFLLPQQLEDEDAWTRGHGVCTFCMSITTVFASGTVTHRPLYHLERMWVTLADSEATGKLTAVRHVLAKRCRWHEDCLEHPELNEACVAARRGSWTRTHRVQRNFWGIGLGNVFPLRRMGLWKPNLDPIYGDDRLDLVFTARWDPKRVGPGRGPLARVTAELIMQPYQVAP